MNTKNNLPSQEIKLSPTHDRFLQDIDTKYGGNGKSSRRKSILQWRPLALAYLLNTDKIENTSRKW